jgi:hypothetical protein
MLLEQVVYVCGLIKYFQIMMKQFCGLTFACTLMNMLNKVNCCLLCECVANAQALINTMWLNMTQQFGLRGRHEHVQMLWGDVDMKTDPAGRTYLEFNERCTKTRNDTSRMSDASLQRCLQLVRQRLEICILFVSAHCLNMYGQWTNTITIFNRLFLEYFHIR